MDKKLKKKVEKILARGKVGYAYFYPNDGSERQEFVFNMKPENIANFVGGHFLDASKIILTDQTDRLILDTYGGFINCCPDKRLRAEVVNLLAPIQMSGGDAEEFPMITRDEYEEYRCWEGHCIHL